jgi:hypothetical protein
VFSARLNQSSTFNLGLGADLIFTHIFCWTTGVEFEVQLSPWFPSAVCELGIRARLQAVPQKASAQQGFSP